MFGFKFGGAKHEDETPAGAAEGVYVTARLNAKLQPMDRGGYYEEPLTETLEAEQIGEVTGGGTQLTDEPCGIEFCDLEIRLDEMTDHNLAKIIKRLNDLGAPKGSRLILEASGKEIPFGVAEGIAVYLNGSDLPANVYAMCDVNFVVEEFDRLLAGRGEFRGYWEGEKETALFCYGPSFEAMKAVLKPFIDSYPLCERARIEQIA